MDKSHIVKVVGVMLECIRTVKEYPSGHLYAQMMTMGLDLRSYEFYEAIMLRTGLVEKQSSGLLIWKGPEIADEAKAS